MRVTRWFPRCLCVALSVGAVLGGRIAAGGAPAAGAAQQTAGRQVQFLGPLALEELRNGDWQLKFAVRVTERVYRAPRMMPVSAMPRPAFAVRSRSAAMPMTTAAGPGMHMNRGLTSARTKDTMARGDVRGPGLACAASSGSRYSWQWGHLRAVGRIASQQNGQAVRSGGTGELAGASIVTQLPRS